MSRHWLLFYFLFGLSTVAQAQSSTSTPEREYTPVWLPRGAFLGSYLRGGTVTPQARIQWQLTVFQDRKDALVLVLEGGGGFAVALPDTVVAGADEPIDSFHEHTVQVGGGYRNQSPSGFHWGFQVTAGPLWYGAHLRNLPDERYSAGLLEGRVHLGYQLGRVALGVSGGYGEPFSYRRRSVAAPYAGGLLLGVFADWR
ncbi:hypothetical protein [Hyalangium rubrum]|uniref:Cellulose biosynthesis protein BcsS n=1 Tax=Hyalangium rubrum TaxID=3103134 RepID=A0ABU5HI90_9BACT|nr:hypothetical protein [Hyalangium sp. s54d21]MDY7232527.1 hypothetical protein [Hyalangium sp. s54d21]